jgi:hypothetical protein
VSEDPRYQQQIYRRAQALAMPSGAADMDASAFAPEFVKSPPTVLDGIWSENLGSGGSAGAGN